MGASSDYAVFKKVGGVLKELGNEKGELSTIKSNEYVVKDLHMKTLLELQELLHRQKSILKNRSFLAKLPDKGAKLRSRCKEIEDALNQVTLKSRQANGLKDESVTCDSSNINDFEWTKKIDCAKKTEIVETDVTYPITNEVADPLELLATHSFDAPPINKFLRSEEEDPALSIANELSLLEIKDNESTDNNDSGAVHNGLDDQESVLEFSIRLIKKLELQEKTNPVRKQFKPFRPLKNSLAELKSNKTLSTNSKKSSLWKESAATGLFESSSHPAQLISLQESLRLLGVSQKMERDQKYKLAEHSLARYPRTEIGLPSSISLQYRDSNTTNHILDDSDEDDDLSVPFDDEAESEND